MGVWEYGSMGVWEYGNMGIWEYGNMGIWEYGNMGIWVYGNMGRKINEIHQAGEYRGGSFADLSGTYVLRRAGSRRGTQMESAGTGQPALLQARDRAGHQFLRHREHLFPGEQR